MSENEIDSIEAAAIIDSIRPTDRVHVMGEGDSVRFQFGHEGDDMEFEVNLDGGQIWLHRNGETVYSR